MKTCKCCGTPKDTEAYPRNARGKRDPVCYVCRSAKRRDKDASNLETRYVPCRACGSKVGVEVEPGDADPIKICSYCKEHGSPEHRNIGGYTQMPVSVLCDAVPHGEVIIYRPGEPDFYPRARDTTPIKQVRRIGSLSAPFQPSVWRD